MDDEDGKEERWVATKQEEVSGADDDVSLSTSVHWRPWGFLFARQWHLAASGRLWLTY